MKYAFTFLIGLMAGVAIHWYLTQPQGREMASHAGESIRETTGHMERALKDTFNSEKIKDELSRTGRVIREKTDQAGRSLSDAAENARITATVKAKLIKEPNLSAFKIDVDNTDGVVTLSGTVSSYDEIGRAMQLAWETDGVQKVVSNLQVKAN